MHCTQIKFNKIIDFEKTQLKFKTLEKLPITNELLSLRNNWL